MIELLLKNLIFQKNILIVVKLSGKLVAIKTVGLVILTPPTAIDINFDIYIFCLPTYCYLY